jgi:hypothetical protein
MLEPSPERASEEALGRPGFDDLSTGYEPFDKSDII